MAEPIPVVEFRGILTETLFAFLAREDLECVRLPDAWDFQIRPYHLLALKEHVVLSLLVALGTIEPFPA